jgi:polyphosphate:AMP phosphotransferase
VTKSEWELFKLYDEFTTYTKRAIRRTDTPDAPWIIVDAADERYRNLTVSKVLLDRLRASERAGTAAAPMAASPIVNARADGRLLRSLDGTRSLSRASYAEQLEKYQGRLNLLARHRKFRKRSVVAVFEGWDAAGKGGCIQRVIGSFDPRQYHIVPTAAPTDEERAQPYLWRFWRNVPGHGVVAIFDRSWYGRVLVERVEGFCSEADWMRAYGEINDFEQQLIRNGGIVAKFWLNIGKDEQLRRFKEREQTGFKRFKITDEDWRNRNQWDTYEQAVCDMVDRTSTEIAPWTLVEADDKAFARIKVLKTLCTTVRDALR